MRVLDGAEPYHADGGPVGVLLCHGFTGSPQSLRAWAEHLAARGLTVALPRLPGHGTAWQEMALTRWPDWYATVDRALRDLSARCDAVLVCGLSMGGTLALRLAEEHGDRVNGLVLVNPSLMSEARTLRLVPLLRLAVPAVRGLAGDVKRPGVREVGYDRVPLQALHSLTELWSLTAADLGRVDQPILLFRSVEDHVVDASSSARILGGVASADVEERLCRDSYHVATLDNDAEAVFAGTLEFLHRLLPATGPAL